jgi:transmembrane sensor
MSPRPSVPYPQTASQWFALYQSGTVDQATDLKWREWLAADPAHERAYEECELAWELSREVGGSAAIRNALAELDEQLATRSPVAAGGRPPARRLWSWLAAAASLGALSLLTLWLTHRSPVEVADYATGVGEQRTVTLADQSTITLNTDTAVRATYSQGSRRIDLQRGEALFGVTKNAARPFEVHALDGVSVAVGTQYDVRIDGNRTDVSVLEGTVSVKSSGADPQSVSAGEAVDYAQGGTVSAPHPADTNQIRGWQSQRIVINDATLADALREYNRYTKLPIVLGSPELGDRRVNGVFHIGDEDAFLGALEQGLHVKISKTATQIVIERR